ncbi:30S ribosomal protein S20 [Buchnera aphidicola (Aphis craccivora)]|uniref:Small ribosomal subunit protein bS20 n=1 Tax=Buchnera aphidicola (Aphis craccivora) TaxID=466616 RepID=A0A4D6XJC8_9GAMM|nr:30S ribosomal protein S20 [Buchnera aphidicola]QCI16413.1 30S ribosomal protein S20 [Buchnera aphidicola (Aphis craccivora)]QLL40554.1 30S ribosomal protein S20 [Buchnera aphidicola (Aphis craccivore)]WAI17922.1 MAG: 30S ribosomal protein S20 [Buchnera aphidicola (Aphis craccivora)]
MANIKSSKKDSIASEQRRKNNMSQRSKIRTFIKKVRLAIFSGDKKKAENAFKTMQSVIDKYSTKGLIHKNKASRHKSILSLQIKKLN